MYADYDLAIPDTLDAALGILADNKTSSTMPLAGGTNLIIDIRSKREQPEHVVALNKIDELRGLKCDDARISIGARTTVSDLLASPEIAVAAPSLIDAAKVFAGLMVRNAATVAGNIACGSPAADLVPPLLSLDADVTLASKSGTRTIPLDEYYLGYKKDARRADELITGISWPRLAENSVNSFYKLARRKGDAITITGVAVTLTVANGVCEKARIALGAVSPIVMRAKKAEALLEGQQLTAALIDAAARQAVEESSPIDDVRASAEYRLHTVEVLTRRLVSQAWQALS
ncbi:MAG: xanthine dehydrogenase family protein subunit M [Fimbriimonadaceae bacterium]|nr:xanthine dehydrogenase family protein subunit M [Alphaproteobacteria bacterium]